MAHVAADERRERFIAAAVDVIAEVGVGRATTRKIAERAGAPLTTLHYCFQTKENLFYAVLQHLADLDMTLPEPEVSESRSLESAAQNLLSGALLWMQANQNFALAQLDVALWAVREDREQGTKIYDMFLPRYVTSLQRLAGPDMDVEEVEAVARVILALFDGFLIQNIFYNDPVVWKKNLETCRRLFDLRAR